MIGALWRDPLNLCWGKKRLSTKQQAWAHLERTKQRYALLGYPPPPKEPMKPCYMEHGTCDECWRPYNFVWWHRLIHKCRHIEGEW